MDSANPKNVLLLGKHSTIAEDLFNIALQQARRGRTVFYLSSKRLESLPESFGRYDQSIQKRILFIYFKSLDALIQKLLDFHNMSVPPSLIIIDSLHTFFASQPNQPKSLDYFMQRHSLIFATLQNCVHSFDGRLNEVCWSIVTLDNSTNYHYERSLTTFIDLFYFKKNYLKVDSNFIDWINELMVKYVK